jgi:hypothetical protein
MKAPVYEILKNGKIHQHSPSWIVMFVPFSEPRVGYSASSNVSSKLATKDPIIVLNDAIYVSVVRAKSSFIKTASITLKLGELNYKEKVRPGDYVLIWMFDWQEDANEIYKKLIAGQPANDFYSGLKFVGRVGQVSLAESVGKNGRPDLTVNISASMFNEYNSSIYIHPLADINAATGANVQNSQTFLATFGKVLFEKYFKEGGVFKSPDGIIKILIQIFLGSGPDSSLREATKKAIGQDVSFSDPILVPSPVCSVLGSRGLRPLIDISHYYLGVEKYTPGMVNPAKKDGTAKMYPTDTVLDGTFRSYPSRPLKGNIFLDIAPWSNQSIINILRSFLNPVCNELFSCMRYDDRGGIRPTVVARQIPYTTNLLDFIGGKQKSQLADFIKNANKSDSKKIEPSLFFSNTKYVNLPRWKLDGSRIRSKNTGTDENRRVNFVQVFGSSTASVYSQVQIDQPGSAKSASNPDVNNQITQFALNNYIQDTQDIRRNGLRSVIMQTPFDIITLGTGAGVSLRLLSPYWAALQADFLFNGHLHEVGKISCVGITEPICEGDNLELDGVLYHIEEIEHKARISGSKKEFVTILTVSRGTLVESLEGNGVPVYPCQANTYNSMRFGQTDRQFTLHSNRNVKGEQISIKKLASGESE